MQVAVSKPINAKPRVVMSTAEIQRTLGAMLLKEGLVTPNDLNAVQERMAGSADAKPLLSWLRELAVVDEIQILDCVRRCQPDIPIGGLLVELQYVQADQLAQAVAIQLEESYERKLGQILLDNNWVNQNDLGKSLAAQLGFEFINPTFEQIHTDLIEKAGADTCKQFNFIPMVQRDGSVVVAFADPMDQQARTGASRALSAVIVPVMCTASCVSEQLTRCAAPSKGVAVETNDTDEVDLNDLVQLAISSSASDIHIEPLHQGSRVRLRVAGLLQTTREISHEQRQEMIAKLKNLAELDINERGRHQSGRFTYEGSTGSQSTKMLCSFLASEAGESAVIRVNARREDVVELDQLGIYDSVLKPFKEHALEAPSGSIIITGPYGSGKTSTLYSCIDHLNSEQGSIVTAEDHIEYSLDGVKQCLVSQHKGSTYLESLRHMLKQDPDVIVMGEVRDQEVAQAAMQTMLGGHKVLTTFSSGDGVGVLLRMKNINSEVFTVSSTVKSMISQRLVRKVCQNCAVPYQPSVNERERYGLTLEDLSIAEFTQGMGCSTCDGSGYDGRIGVYEVLIVDELLRAAVLAGKTSAQIRQAAVQQSGLITLIEDGILKAASGITSLQELNRVLPRATDPRSLSELRTLVF